MDHKPAFKTRTEIAKEFGISPKTLKKLAEENDIELPVRSLITPRVYSQIKEALYQEGNSRKK